MWLSTELMYQKSHKLVHCLRPFNSQPNFIQLHADYKAISRIAREFIELHQTDCCKEETGPYQSNFRAILKLIGPPYTMLHGMLQCKLNLYNGGAIGQWFRNPFAIQNPSAIIMQSRIRKLHPYGSRSRRNGIGTIWHSFSQSSQWVNLYDVQTMYKLWWWNQKWYTI